MKNYWYGIIGLVLIGLGVAIGHYTLPAKVIVKTETKTVVQTVTNTVDKTDDHKDKVLIETTTTKPDGTIIKEREYVDKSVVTQDDESNTKTDSTTTSSTTTEKTYSDQKGSVKFLFAKNASNLATDIYGLSVDKKLIGPFSVGVFGLTDKTGGVSLGVNF